MVAIDERAPGYTASTPIGSVRITAAMGPEAASGGWIRPPYFSRSLAPTPPLGPR